MRTAAATLVVAFMVGCGPASTGKPNTTASSTAPEAPATTTEAAPSMAVGSAPVAAGASAAVGQPAPDFTLTSTEGATVRLSDYAGKTVVLEWFNPGCPFVKDAHDTDKMTALAEKWAAQGVVWLAVNSGAPGKQGAGVETNQQARTDWKMGYPVLLDETGAVGQAYGAKTTPHMYVIDPSGTLVFAGAFSNAPLGNVDGGGTEFNYVDAALSAVATGRPVTEITPKPWGCSVKYGS